MTREQEPARVTDGYLGADRRLAARKGSGVSDSGDAAAGNPSAHARMFVGSQASCQKALEQELRESDEVAVFGIASRSFLMAVQSISTDLPPPGRPFPWRTFTYVTPAPQLIFANRGAVRLGTVVQRWRAALSGLRNCARRFEAASIQAVEPRPGFRILCTETLHLEMSLLVKRRDSHRRRLWISVGPSGANPENEMYLVADGDTQEYAPLAASLERFAAEAVPFVTRQVLAARVPEALADAINENDIGDLSEGTDSLVPRPRITSLAPYGDSFPQHSCLPTAACVVRSRTGTGDIVLLKKRTELTSNDGFGKLSLLSSRVEEEDVAGALDVSLFSGLEPDRAIDEMWKASGRRQHIVLERHAFMRAAQREMFFSCGLDIPESRFEFRGYQVIEREDSLGQLLFCVFEIVLSRAPDELDQALAWNPENLQRVTESALYSGAYDGKLNRLLVRRADWLKRAIFSTELSSG